MAHLIVTACFLLAAFASGEVVRRERLTSSAHHSLAVEPSGVIQGAAEELPAAKASYLHMRTKSAASTLASDTDVAESFSQRHANRHKPLSTGPGGSQDPIDDAAIDDATTTENPPADLLQDAQRASSFRNRLGAAEKKAKEGHSNREPGDDPTEAQGSSVPGGQDELDPSKVKAENGPSASSGDSDLAEERELGSSEGFSTTTGVQEEMADGAAPHTDSLDAQRSSKPGSHVPDGQEEMDPSEELPSASSGESFAGEGKPDSTEGSSVPDGQKEMDPAEVRAAAENGPSASSEKSGDLVEEKRGVTTTEGEMDPSEVPAENLDAGAQQHAKEDESTADSAKPAASNPNDVPTDGDEGDTAAQPKEAQALKVDGDGTTTVAETTTLM